MQTEGFASNFLDRTNPEKNLLFRPDEVFYKIVDEADKLSKKVVINDIIKTANDSSNFINILKNASDQSLGNRNNFNK